MKSGKQRTIDGLLACGWVLDTNARTSKYQVFAPTFDERYGNEDRKLLVGKSGALRLLTAKRTAVADSLSITGGSYHKALQVVGDRKDSYSSAEQARKDLESVRQELVSASCKTNT